MSNEITVIDQLESVKDMVKSSEGLIQISSIDETTKKLVELKEKYQDFEVTEENIQEAKIARSELRAPRYDFQNIEKHNVGVFEAEKKKLKGTYSTLIAINRPIEERIHEGIIKVEKEKERQRLEAKRVEEERVREINDRIEKITFELPKIYENCISLRSIDKLEQRLTDLGKDDSFQEFKFKVEDIVDMYRDKIPGLINRINTILKEEAEKKRLEEENQRLQKEAKEKEISDNLDNFGFLLDTFKLVGGDPNAFIRTKENPPTDLDFENLKKAIAEKAKPQPEPEKLKEPTGQPLQPKKDCEAIPENLKESAKEAQKIVDSIPTIKGEPANAVKEPEAKKEEIQKPTPLAHTNLDVEKLEQICVGYIDFLFSDDYHPDHDFKTWIEEAALAFIFGDDVFDTINKKIV